MHSRRLGKTGSEVSEIGFGAWAIGGAWGDTDDDQSLAAMRAAVDAGVTFFDTADVYGDGRSERLIARLLQTKVLSFSIWSLMKNPMAIKAWAS